MNAPQEHSLYSQDTPDNQQDHREHQEKQTRKETEDGMHEHKLYCL